MVPDSIAPGPKWQLIFIPHLLLVECKSVLLAINLLRKRRRGKLLRAPVALKTNHEKWHYQTQQGSQGYPVSPTYSTTFQYYQPQSPVYDGPSSPIYASPISQYPVATTPSGVVYTTNIVAATQLYMPQQAYTYAVPYMNSSYSSNPTSPTSPPPVVKTEARKIIITQLPHGTTSSALHELLTKIVSNSKRLSHYSSAAVQSIEIATHVDGKAKGHAFAIFETHTVAKTVIRAVDGMRFQGRVLSARFAKEGAEPARYSSVMSEKQAVVSSAELFQAQDSASGQWWGHGNETNGTMKMEQKAKGDSGRESASKSPRSSKEADEKDGVVVSSEVKKSRGMSAPVVVDGSSSRGSHGREKKHRS